MPPPNDNFASSVALAGDYGTVTETTENATFETGEPQPYAANNKTIWYHWVATATGTVRLRTRGTAANKTGGPGPAATAATLYTGSAVNALTAVDDGIAAGNYNYSFPVTAGTTYRIQVQFQGQQTSFPFAALVGPITLTWNVLAPSPIEYRGASSAQNTGTTVTVSTPPDTDENDVMFAFIAAETSGTLTLPTGWVAYSPMTQWGNIFGGIGSGSMWIYAAAKIANATDEAGTTYNFTVSGTSRVSVGVVTYRNVWVDYNTFFGLVVPRLSPGTQSSTAYRSSGLGGAGGTSGPNGVLVAHVPDTVELDADATAGGSGGALTITGGATERARVDGLVPLIVSEGPASWSFPSANEVFVYRLLLAPDEPFGEFPAFVAPAIGWAVGIRMN